MPERLKARPGKESNGELAVQAFLEGQAALEASTAKLIEEIIARVGFKVPSLSCGCHHSRRSQSLSGTKQWLLGLPALHDQ
jgi:hypothetical protein